MSTGTGLLHRVMLALGQIPRVRVFRNNVALAWVGSGKAYIHRGAPKTTVLQAGDVVLRQARPLHAGLVVGSSDLIGWTTRVMTAEDVGKAIAIFTAIESKDGKHKEDPAQRRFIQAVEAAGGIAGVVRSEQDALELVEDE